MPSKPKNKLLSELLNLKGVKVKGYQNYQDIGIILVLSATQKQAICHRCQNKSNELHQNHWYTIKDLPILGQPVYLTINRRQFKCQHCRVPFSEELDYVKKKRRYTKRLAQDIVQQVLADDIKTVAQKKAVIEEEIQTMLRDVGEELIKSKPNGLKKLGIDEIALIKGQGNYCAVLVDLEASKLVGILEGRTQDELRKTLQQWGKEVLIQIEEVSIDLWKPYKNLVEELMPNAQVVADRFHVMKQVNEELDRQRKKERNAAEIDFLKKLIKANPAKKIIIFWDGVSYHRGETMQDFLEEVNGDIEEKDWRITCHLFPAYAPEENPIEAVWLSLKNLLRRCYRFCKNFTIMKRLFQLI